MASEWIVLSSVAEKDEFCMPDYPWYPALFDKWGNAVGSFEVWFATEEECRQFIKDHVLGATLEEERCLRTTKSDPSIGMGNFSRRSEGLVLR